jgi:hypothetical protein
MTNPLMPYKGIDLADQTFIYAPYIPLTMTTTIIYKPTIKQHQSNDQTFSFYTDKHLDALGWVIKEAKGKYELIWLDNHHYHIQITFTDRAVATMFKLKFFNV